MSSDENNFVFIVFYTKKSTGLFWVARLGYIKLIRRDLASMTLCKWEIRKRQMKWFRPDAFLSAVILDHVG